MTTIAAHVRRNAHMLILCAFMLAGAALALTLKPTKLMVDPEAIPNLDALVPNTLGPWTVDKSIVPLEPSPEVRAQLNRIYNQTLSRTYVNAAGDRIMLSVVYGGDQSDSMQVHRPEVCYAAQGFDIVRSTTGNLSTRFGVLPVKRLVAVQGSRMEPITYWIVTGGKTTLPGVQQKFAQLSFGLTGRVPDGFLVRVSSISRDQDRAYTQHHDFVEQMFGNMDSATRMRIAPST